MKDRNVKHRFFVTSLAGERVELPPEEARHALTVLRLTAGAEVELFDGSGGAATGRLAPAGKRGAAVEIIQRRQAARGKPVIELAFAVPKGKRLDWLLEKATELGAGGLWPVVFERSVAAPELAPHALERWRGACTAAAKQCGADHLPEIHPPVELGTYLDNLRGNSNGDSARILGDPDGENILAVLGGDARAESVTILVGPEGGITAPEHADILRAGFAPVRLGNLILRVETAAIALLAAVQALQPPTGE